MLVSKILQHVIFAKFQYEARVTAETTSCRSVTRHRPQHRAWGRPHDQAAWPSTRRPTGELPSAGHDHRRTRAYAVVEIQHVRIVHADATVRHETADGSRIVSAMDGVFSATAQRHGCRAHGIGRTAAWNDTRQGGLVAPDFFGRRPCRAELLVLDNGRAGPLLTRSPNPNRVAHCLAVPEDVIQRSLFGFHHHRTA